MNLKIAVVILNWNGRNLLDKFLPSVVKHSAKAEIHLADNASTDDSVDFVKRNFPQIKIIQNFTNGGYAKGYNDALKNIDSDIFCLLNSDVEVTSNWLEPIISEFESDSETAIIQPKILDFKDKNCFEYAGAAGGFIDKFAYPFCRGRIFNSIEKDEGQYDNNLDIFWASGACLFIRSTVFFDLNGFDEKYFSHFEEIDLCWRAFNSGYRTQYIGGSTVYHLGGGTLNKVSAKKTYLNFRNSLFTVTKNAEGVLFLRILIRLILDGIAAIRFLLQLNFNHFASVLQAHFSFYWNLPYLLKERKKLPNKKHNYFKISSVVCSYFIKKNTKFSEL